MRVAVLADVHGNLPALRAVLDEMADEQPDTLVVAGDIVGGAYPREALELLAARPEQLVWVRGNAEREAVAAWDGAPVADDEPGRAAAWSAQALDLHWRDKLASWPVAVTLDGVCYCHGSPRADDEILTRLTPDAVLREIVDGLVEPMVVGGHTHQQFVRKIHRAPTYVNAGSVGMPYEGRPGAFWLVVEDGQPLLRVTYYDVDAATTELRVSGFADAESQLGESLLEPVDPDWVAAFLSTPPGANRIQDRRHLAAIRTDSPLRRMPV